MLPQAGKNFVYVSKMKKSKLVIEYDFDFDAYGIISSARGYRLAWELNRYLNIHLVRHPDVTVGFRNEANVGFPHYSFETQVSQLKLLSNRPADRPHGKYFLMPEFPHYDYIVLARLHDRNPNDTLLDELKQIPSVELTSPIALEELKSKTNFVF